MSIFNINPFEQLQKMREMLEQDKQNKIIENLKKYFAAEDEYILEQNVGGGIQANAYKIKRTTPGSSEYERIVVKVPNAPPIRGTENNERDVMLALRGAAHVVRHIDFPDKPDDAQKTGVSSRLPADGWIYMEWLENGTLGDFLRKINASQKPLPNRLQWRLYMCFVRACIALAWPEAHKEGNDIIEQPQEGVPAYAYDNRDMHYGNWVFDQFVPNDPSDPDSDHRLTPILKMIDLGIVKRVVIADNAEWDKLVNALQSRLAGIMVWMNMIGRKPKDLTLDGDLREIANRCLSLDPAMHLSLPDLAERILLAINNRDAAYYEANMGGDPPDRDTVILAEEDNAILALIKEFILDADA